MVFCCIVAWIQPDIFIYFVCFNMRHPVIIYNIYIFFKFQGQDQVPCWPCPGQGNLRWHHHRKICWTGWTIPEVKIPLWPEKTVVFQCLHHLQKQQMVKTFDLFTYCFLDFVWEIIFSFFWLLQKLIVFDSTAVWFIRRYPEFEFECRNNYWFIFSCSNLSNDLKLVSKQSTGYFKISLYLL